MGPVPSSCPACGDGSALNFCLIPDHEYGLKQLARYGHCESCHTIFQDPMPKPAELLSFYPESYHSMNSSGLLTRIRHDLRIKRLKSLASGEGVVLDYGCGNGSFLLRAAESMPGKIFFGFEMDEHRDITSLSHGAVTLVRGSLRDLLELLPSCCLITMNHVIEHLPDPYAIVSTLHAKLVKGGILEGQTPATDSLEHRVFGERWSGYHAPRHTVVFSRLGLRQILERAGYSRIDIQRAFNPASLAVSLASLAQGSSPGLIPRRGLRWFALLSMATLLAPFDLLSGAPSIINFMAQKNED